MSKIICSHWRVTCRIQGWAKPGAGAIIVKSIKKGQVWWHSYSFKPSTHRQNVRRHQPIPQKQADIWLVYGSPSDISWPLGWLLSDGDAGRPAANRSSISALNQWLRMLIKVFWWEGYPLVRTQQLSGEDQCTNIGLLVQPLRAERSVFLGWTKKN